MASTSEGSDNSRTLPRAELNPLLNPLLASHMGRWAEVYFTSPPEKREEAVLDLLRELEAESPGSVPVPATPEELMEAAPYFSHTQGNGSSAAPIEQRLVRCQRCGHDNPVAHQFCGMCGFLLKVATVEESRTDHPYGQHQGEMESPESHAPFHAARQALPESHVYESQRPEDEPSADPYDLSMLQGLRQREIDDYEYQEPSSPPFRYYIGAVLTILLVLLGYMAWRSGQMTQSSHQASAPPPPAQSAPAGPSAPPQATTAAPSSPPKTQPPSTSSPNTNVAETAKPQMTESASYRAAGSVQNSTAVAAPITTAGTEPQFTSSSGTDDLAMAQRYLNQGNGQVRDTTEAVRWLWKAVGKHNGPATLQLADIFLKGDGVTKNCEQARVLLDTAARRGMTGAGERLRNLQAFGCQ